MRQALCILQKEVNMFPTKTITNPLCVYFKKKASNKQITKLSTWSGDIDFWHSFFHFELSFHVSAEIPPFHPATKPTTWKEYPQPTTVRFIRRFPNRSTSTTVNPSMFNDFQHLKVEDLKLNLWTGKGCLCLFPRGVEAGLDNAGKTAAVFVGGGHCGCFVGGALS